MTVSHDTTNVPAAGPAPACGVSEVIDALYRFAEGQDRRVRELFESAFGHDAIVDFTHPAQRFGKTLPRFVGRAAIADTIMGTTASMITTHSVSNPRVTVSGDRAELTALVEAQHVLRDDRSRYLLLKNFYTLALSRRGTSWEIDHMKIENAWYSGDPKVLFGPNATP